MNRRGPDWLAHNYLNLAWLLDNESFAFVAEQYFRKSREVARGLPVTWYS